MYDKFSVIIPEHNRPEHLKRLLNYFLSFEIEIIVADSSNVEFKYLNEFEEKITYKFYPKLSLADKINKIIPLIKTPYVVMCANDDFLVPETINKIISFLEDNKDYNSGQGIYIDFTPTENEIATSLRYARTADIDLNDYLPSERLLHLQRNYFQYYYAVFRTEAFIKVYSSLIIDGKSHLKNLNLLESYISSFTAIDGKHIIFPILYSARENIANSAGFTTPSIPEVISQKKYRDEYDTYLVELAEFLAIKEGITLQKAKEIVELSVHIYIDDYYPGYFTVKEKIKRNITAFIKILGIYKQVLKMYLVLKPVPHQSTSLTIKGMKYWGRIEESIEKYKYIYKE